MSIPGGEEIVTASIEWKRACICAGAVGLESTEVIRLVLDDFRNE